jgi:tripartite-type tricarboxylate transporter receptor subunit TctC
MAGVNILNVPYKGGAPATIAVASGEVSMTFGGGGSLAPHLKAGKVIALAVTGPAPSPLYPGLPTIAATLPGYELTSWTVVLAPAKTPAAIINRLNREIVRVLSQADVKERFLSMGMEAATSSPQELAAGLKAEISRWSKLIKDVGIREE